jgi:hypothetical protein
MTATIEDRIAALEKQQQVQTDALRYLVEGKWVGDLPTAAAEIASLYGEKPPEDFKPIPFDAAP